MVEDVGLRIQGLVIRSSGFQSFAYGSQYVLQSKLPKGDYEGEYIGGVIRVIRGILGVPTI